MQHSCHQPRLPPSEAQPLPRRRAPLRLTDASLLFQITFYILVKAIYTLGYSVSLISLTTGSIILCLFR